LTNCSPSHGLKPCDCKFFPLSSLLLEKPDDDEDDDDEEEFERENFFKL
jgi:hypothetical protein